MTSEAAAIRHGPDAGLNFHNKEQKRKSRRCTMRHAMPPQRPPLTADTTNQGQIETTSVQRVSLQWRIGKQTLRERGHDNRAPNAAPNVAQQRSQHSAVLADVASPSTEAATHAETECVLKRVWLLAYKHRVDRCSRDQHVIVLLTLLLWMRTVRAK
jgi:hypothetical protein